MGILGNIMHAIFGSKAGAAPAAPSGGSSGSAAPAGGSAAGGSPTGGSAPGGSAASTSSTSGAAPAAGSGPVDVAAILDAAVAKKKEKLAWRTSIVDLMKALDLDSSLAARKELAKDLHYTGDTSDSAKMNVWLHKQVMTKLAENGGKVPDDLKA